MPGDHIGVGIIGCGRIFDMHMLGYEGRDDAAVLAVADISEERRCERAERYGIPWHYDDHREMLENKNIDLVEILTPHHLHRDMALEAIAAGKHVSLQKPPALNVGDFDAVALLPYFELYRALVRAKVAALLGQQALYTAPGAKGAATLAHQYLDWAVSQFGRPRPRLVVMVGLSGSGKTWLARRIAARCTALIVRSDVERKRLAGLQPMDTSASAPDAGIYSRGFNARTYQRLRACAANCLRGREGVIVDAANLRRDERELFLATGREHAAGQTACRLAAGR